MQTDLQNPTPHRLYPATIDMHPNLILGGLHLLCWLFLHPSAWHNYLKHLDATLSSDFALADLSLVQWRNAGLRRVLTIGHIILPALIGLLVGLALWILGEPSDRIVGVVFIGVAVIIVYGVALSAVVIGAGGIASGVAGGLAFIAVITIMGSAAVDLAFIVALGVAVGVALSMVGMFGRGPTNSGRPLSRAASLIRQLGAVIIGIVTGIIPFAVAFGVAFGLAGGVDSQAFGDAGNQPGNIAVGLAYGLAGGGVGGLFVGLATGWHARRWRRGVVGGVTLGLASAIAGGMTFGMTGVIAGGVTIGVTISTSFALPYILAERIAGIWAGVVAGALGSAGGWAILSAAAGATPVWPSLPLNLACILLGLALPWWLSILLYPFETAWNLLLLWADERRDSAAPNLLRWHSVFWDEHQRLQLLSLEEHLIRATERNPIEGQTIINVIAGGHQRWAAQAAQIELDARRLASCDYVTAIGNVHHHLAAGELEGPASALLRSFHRISQDVESVTWQASAYNQRMGLSAVADRLDGLLRELNRSSDRYATRFGPIATHWQRLLATQIRALTEAAEARQEIDSPYVIGVPLTEQQEIFVGRADISARIEHLLLDRRRPPLLLYGQRRMGKTSLLNNLGRLLPHAIIPLFVDLQGPASQASDHAGLFYYLARSMAASALRHRDLQFPLLAREALMHDPFIVFDDWLTETEAVMRDGTALLMMDEFEVLDRAFTKGRLDEEGVLGMIRHIIQHHPGYKVLLAGSHGLDEFRQWSSYLINAQTVQIGYLLPEEARQLIERPVKDFALQYEPDASQRVLALTRGHPFLVQLLCAEIVVLKNRQEPSRRRLACLSDVEVATVAALHSGDMFFADIAQNQVDATGLTVLRTAAAQGEGAVIRRGDLSAATSEALDNTLDQLIRRELIERVDSGYRFQVELIRRWFVGQPD